MKQYPHLYIDGQWVEPVEPRDVELIDPTREEAFARVALGSAADADRAVAAARRAFESFSTTLGGRAHRVDRPHHRGLRVAHRRILRVDRARGRHSGQQPRSGHGPSRPHEGGPGHSARVPLRVAVWAAPSSAASRSASAR